MYVCSFLYMGCVCQFFCAPNDPSPTTITVTAKINICELVASPMSREGLLINPPMLKSNDSPNCPGIPTLQCT